MSDNLEYLLEFTKHHVYDLVPEIPLYVGVGDNGEIDEVKSLHMKLGANTSPPFWAFVWPGGQALARCTLDNPELVRGKRVLEIGPGTGINTAAALMAGAQHVMAVDLEPMSCDLTWLNCEVLSLVTDHNLTTVSEKVTREEIAMYDIVIMGDCFYDGQAAHELGELATSANKAGVPFIIGDPKREYTPVRRCTKLAQYNVPNTFKLERNVSTPAFVYEVGAI